MLGIPESLIHMAGVEPVSKIEANNRSVGHRYCEQWQRVKPVCETVGGVILHVQCSGTKDGAGRWRCQSCL